VILAIDVYYEENIGTVVGVVFEWYDEKPKEILTEKILDVAEYIPGEFYRRELPCIIKILEKVNLDNFEAIIVDGHVYIDNEENLGLGGKLYEVLEKRIPVIGVAKNQFFSNKKMICEVYRGESNKPLYVSSIGIDLDYAVENIKKMKGSFRIPDILKQLDSLTKYGI
jgi:deoxyribonuclease V